MRHLRGLFLGASLVFGPFAWLSGCHDGAPPVGPRNGEDLRQLLTASAASALDASGRFVFPPPQLTAPDEITKEEAQDLATAFIARFAPMGGLPGVEQEHGKPIDYATLKACRRSLYAKSPWQPLDPAVTATPGGAVYQRAYGAYWLILFCDASEQPTLLISVSTHSKDLSIRDGMIVTPPTGGEWFHYRGVPLGRKSELPVGPEEAAVLVATLTGSRVAAVPQLIAPRRSDGFPADARWRVKLETTATVNPRATREHLQTTELYLGWRPREEKNTIDIPSRTQPNTEQFRYPTNLTPQKKGDLTYAQGVAVRDPSVPVDFDIITTTANLGR